MAMSRMTWIALGCAGVAAAYLALLFVVQRSMLFPIPAHSPGDPGEGAEVLRITGDGAGASALFLAPSATTGRAPLVIFTHGNGELADFWIEDFEVPRTWGMAVLLVEYPGYGRAPGTPSEKSIMDAVRAAYDWAAADPRIDPNRIVAYGRSLGGGAAARLATDRKVAAVILESAFTSVADFAAKFFAPAFLIRDPFDSRDALKSYRGPLLVIHGRQDTIVPIAHGRELAALVPGAAIPRTGLRTQRLPAPVDDDRIVPDGCWDFTEEKKNRRTRRTFGSSPKKCLLILLTSLLLLRLLEDSRDERQHADGRAELERERDPIAQEQHAQGEDTRRRRAGNSSRAPACLPGCRRCRRGGASGR